MIAKYLHDTSDPWMLAEDIPGSDLFFFQIPILCFVNRFEEQTGLAYQKVLAKFEGYHMWFYFGQKDSFNVAENITQRLVSEPGYGQKVNDNIVLFADKLSAWARSVPVSTLKNLSDNELWRLYDEHYQLHFEAYTWFWIPNAADMFHNNFTNKIKEHLRLIGVNEESVNLDLVTLTATDVRTPVFDEQQDLLKIVLRIEENEGYKEMFLNKNTEEIYELLSKEIQEAVRIHWAKYYYSKFIFVEGEYTIEDYLKNIQDILKTGVSARKLLADQDEALLVAGQKKKELLSKLHLDKQWSDVFDVFGRFMVTKIYRRYAQLLALHTMDKVLKEIARRKFLSLKQVKFMLRSEVKVLLSGDQVSTETIKRSTACVYYTEQNFETVFISEDAKIVLSLISEKIDENVTTLKGEVGCPGLAKGKVKIIIRAADMTKMNQGDILVSIATDPDIVPAMKKAGAIVTEQGGVTSHAAIVSRELGIPCVIGTKIATKVLKDGDMVEVDANKGIIKKI